ncbi:MAG TPA: CARDB domain-containing protein [Solirubrobacteraceae bacterium]
MRIRVGIAVLLAAVLVTTPVVGQKKRQRPNLVIASMVEPPDTVVPGTGFVSSFTVSNEGPGTARRRTKVRAYLSTTGVGLRGEHLLAGSRRVPRLRAGAQNTARATFTVPAQVPVGTYYLVICADDTRRVKETSERNNCISSGQRLSVASSPQPPTVGPPGAAGPPGAKGATGPTGDTIDPAPLRLPRVELAPADAATDEEDVLEVGPFEFRYECQNATGTDPDFARIIVFSDDQELTTQGAREEEADAQVNVPTGTEVVLLHAERQSDTSPTPDDPETPNTDESNDSTTLRGFVAGRVLVAAADGTQAVVEGWAGIDSNGVGEPGAGNDDECVFGGRVILP